MTETDPELKDLVSQTLQANGLLPKIRAELRAGVFLALESSPSAPEILKNNSLINCAHNPTGAIGLNLIRQLLTALDLQFTLSVFEPESHFGKHYTEVSSEDLADRLGLSLNKEQPLLLTMIDYFLNNKLNKSPHLDATYVKPVDTPLSDVKSAELTPEKADTSDFLVFTPKNKKPEEKGKSLLGDLPPLNQTGWNRGGFTTEEPESSATSSEETKEESKSNEIEEEISEALSNGKITVSNGSVDTTISHISGKSLDHLESI